MTFNPRLSWTPTSGARAHRLAACFVAAIALFQAPAVALAQPEDPAQHAEAVAEAPFQEDQTALNLSLGGSLSTGNTQAYQIDSGGDFRLIRGHHGLGLDARLSYGRANLQDDLSNDFVDTVKNFRSKARYDFFFTPDDAIFLAVAYRWDPFSGLDARIQTQLGYMRNFFNEDKHRFWGELGYDITLDNYHKLPDVEFIDGIQVVHSVRTFLGYNNEVNESVTYLAGLEGLFNVEDAADVRVDWGNALRSKLGGDFQLEAKFTLTWDNVPVPGAMPLDTKTMITLIYTLL